MGHFYAYRYILTCPLPFLLPSTADGEGGIRAVPSFVLSFWDAILFNLEVLMRVVIKVGTSVLHNHMTLTIFLSVLFLQKRPIM